jgi:hypothetical protein
MVGQKAVSTARGPEADVKNLNLARCEIPNSARNTESGEQSVLTENYLHKNTDFDKIL